MVSSKRRGPKSKVSSMNTEADPSNMPSKKSVGFAILEKEKESLREEQKMCNEEDLTQEPQLSFVEVEETST